MDDKAKQYIAFLDEQIAEAERVREENFYPINEQTPEKLKIYNRATSGKKHFKFAKTMFEKIWGLS